jgi:hypothetical protein
MAVTMTTDEAAKLITIGADRATNARRVRIAPGVEFHRRDLYNR